MPAVSVLVPVRDASPWLRTSFASLWRQTFADFEVIAVDDGSRDGSGDWLEAEARREQRLRVVRTAARGLPAALSTALAHARAPVLARHDADDVSQRERFAAQWEALARHRDVGVVGTRVRLFPAAGYGAGMRRWAAWHNALLDHDSMRREALIDSPLAHGSAMLRREALEAVGGWRERGWAEDLDLWLRLLERGVRFIKLARTLYGWRQHAASATRRDRRYARERFVALKCDALQRTLLAGGRRATLVGTGESLARWREALGASVRTMVEARRPSLEPLAAGAPPYVLVFVAPAARERWRAIAARTRLVELHDFIFVA
ncbi:MAG TPA: glycosyltransferase family 2 protein [Candidatus Acidoferrales bacterium]|nr:glycosyltransferase family 2 protein [Candidatus Acidoferrales bacterium]